jgi:perosamine synthetase
MNDQRPPRSAVPPVAVLSPAAFAGGRHAALPSLLDGADVRLVTSGRVAIGLALRALGVGSGDCVLVPAYHSPSMIPPVHWCGARVVFYRVHPDTTVDLDDVAAKLGAESRVKAIMATHFFGVPQDLGPLRALCDRHGVGLIEDCAHCFFGERDGVAVGSSGDYAIGSSMKFFPIYEGGCLVSHRHALDTALSSAGAGFEAKAALNALEAGFAYGRMKSLRAVLALPLGAKTMVWNMLKARARAPHAPADAGSSLAPSSSDSSFDFDPRWADKRSSRFSRLVIRFASRATMRAPAPPLPGAAARAGWAARLPSAVRGATGRRLPLGVPAAGRTAAAAVRRLAGGRRADGALRRHPVARGRRRRLCQQHRTGTAPDRLSLPPGTERCRTGLDERRHPQGA